MGSMFTLRWLIPCSQPINYYIELESGGNRGEGWSELRVMVSSIGIQHNRAMHDIELRV